MNAESRPESFIRPSDLTRRETLRGVNRAVYTLFVTPPHDKLHSIVAEASIGELQPLHPPISTVLDEIREGPMQIVDIDKKRQLSGRELSQLAGVLVQFTDYNPTLQTYAQTPYEHVSSIYEAVTDQASTTAKPLTLPEQLTISLEQTNGDLTEALWRMFITSRQYGRWLDGSSIVGMPEFSTQDKLDQMTKWKKSLAAFKTDNQGPQDAPGDTYYAWTHALSTVAYSVLPARPTRRTALAARTFTNGTAIMHNVAHRYNPQAVVNDHSIAAEYGNAIGSVCAETLRR